MTDINELAQRQKFEAWARSQRLGVAYGDRGYVFSSTEMAWRVWRASSADLVRELEKARQEADELLEFKDVMASAAEALKAGKPLNLESLFRGKLASAMFATMFAGEFVRSGATNYLELPYEIPEFGKMTVTLQKVEGKTPGQRIAELESRTVKLPEPFKMAKSSSELTYYYADEVNAALTASGIKLEGE